jgi:hypothetical protein
MQTDYVVPYTPKGNEFFKFKLIMDTLIPGSSYLFPNERFTPIERVSLREYLILNFRCRLDLGRNPDS